MSISEITIWDRGGNTPKAGDLIYLWADYSDLKDVISIPSVLEDHAEKFRSMYLSFIYDLGNGFIGSKRVVDHLQFADGYSFWWMTTLAEKSPFKSPKIYDCLRLLALEERLIQDSPTFLIYKGSDKQLSQAIKRLCDGLAIGFKSECKFNFSYKYDVKKIYQSAPYVVQGLINLIHYAISWGFFKKNKQRKWMLSENTVLFFSYFIHLDIAKLKNNLFYSNQWGDLPKKIQDMGWKCNWLHHFLPSQSFPDVNSGLIGLSGLNSEAHNNGVHAFLGQYLSSKVMFLAIKRWIGLMLVLLRIKNIEKNFQVKGSAVWLWPLLRDDWTSSLVGSIGAQNCLQVELFEAAMRSIPRQNIGFYLCEMQGWEIALLQAWRNNNHGELFGVVHSTTPFWHLYYMNDPRTYLLQGSCTIPLPDQLAVNGPMAWDMFINSGYPIEKMTKVEALRYLNIHHQVSNARSNSPVSIKNNQAMVKVLVIGDMNPSSMHRMLLMLDNAMDHVGPSIDLTIKQHPGYTVNLNSYPSLKIASTVANLEDILYGFDIILCANSTSSAVDAFIAGKSLIVEFSGEALNLSPMRGLPDVKFISNARELVQAIKKVRSNLMQYEAEKIFFYLDGDMPKWENFLNNNLSKFK